VTRTPRKATGARQIVLAARLISQGKSCGHAGPFHFHVLEGHRGPHHQLNAWDRLRFYERLALVGGVQVVCEACHRSSHCFEFPVAISVLQVAPEPDSKSP